MDQSLELSHDALKFELSRLPTLGLSRAKRGLGHEVDACCSLSPPPAGQATVLAVKRFDMNEAPWMTETLTKLVNLWPATRIDELMPWAYVKAVSVPVNVG
jgi:hypothetical protein